MSCSNPVLETKFLPRNLGAPLLSSASHSGIDKRGHWGVTHLKGSK